MVETEIKKEENKNKEFNFETKEIEIAGDKYVIREYDFEASSRIEAASMNVQMLSDGQPHLDYKHEEGMYLIIKHGMVSGPFDPNSSPEYLKHKVPGKILQKLVIEINKLNKIDEKKSKN